MHKIENLPKMDLHLFDGAAAGAPAGGEGTAQATEGATPKAEVKSTRGSSRRGKTGEFDNVVFGKQEDAPVAETTNTPAAEGDAEGVSKSGVSTTSNTLEEKRAAFKELIEGEYKDQYTEMFQAAFNRRFREVKGMEQSLNDQKPVIDLLLQRYGISDGNMAKLQTAIEEDNHYWEDAAEEAGLTVDQYKAMKKLERENAELRQMRQRQQGQQMAQQKMNQWYAEAAEVKKVYPGFDFRAETADRDFLGMLKAGLSVQQAYEVKHMDEIKAGAARAAAETAGQQMAEKIRSKAARPKENGTSSQSAVIVKNDVHSLSREERKEIARRVARGEQIKF